MSKEYVRIEKEELRRLLSAAHNYRALQAGGVDNWHGYDESRCEYLDEYLFSNPASKVEYMCDIANYEILFYKPCTCAE